LYAPRPIDSGGLGDSGRADPEDEREGIGENLCQPPPLLLPFSRAGVEPLQLPVLGADPEFELPRVSALLSELWPKR